MKLCKLAAGLSCSLFIVSASATAFAFLNLNANNNCHDDNGNPVPQLQSPKGDYSGGGAPGGILHPEVVPIFWGSYWNTHATQMAKKIGQLQYLLNGPYFAGLNEYQSLGQGPGRMVPIAPINTTTPYPVLVFPTAGAPACTQSSDCHGSNTCSQGFCEQLRTCTCPAPDSSGCVNSKCTSCITDTCEGQTSCFIGSSGTGTCQLSATYLTDKGGKSIGGAPATLCGMVDGMMTNGLVPAAQQGANGALSDQLYVVFLDPSYSEGTATGWPTANDNFSCTSPAGVSYRAAFIWATDGGCGLSHEMVEAISTNIWVKAGSCPSEPIQLADLCACPETALTGTSNEITLSAYWSHDQKACVIPEAWNGVYQYHSGSPDSWSSVGGSVRQIYAGGMGLVATRPNDDVYLYNATGWANIGGPGAMYSVGQSWISGLTVGADQIAIYQPSTGFVGQPYGALAVYSGAFDIAPDFQGYPWEGRIGTGGYYQVQVGSTPSDQFVVGDQWAAALDFTRENVSLFAGSPASWTTPMSQPATELLTGPGQALAARDPSTGGVWTMVANGVGNPGSWLYMSGTGSSAFALSGDAHAPLAAVCEDSMMRDIDPLQSAPDWSFSSTFPLPTVGRLVGQGGNLYATGDVLYQLASGTECTQPSQCTPPLTCTASNICD